MDKIKKYIIYIIIIVGFYFLSNFLTIHLMKTTYNPKQYTIDQDSSPKVEITDFKATVTNGYVNGKITNDTGENINGKYLKLDYYSKNGVNLGTKYVEINNLHPGESMDFSSQFNFDNVDNVKTSIVDQKDLPANLSLKSFLSDELRLDVFHAPWYIWLAAMFFFVI